MALPILPPVVEALRSKEGGPRRYNDNYIFYWNDVGLDLIRLTHPSSGHQNGPPLSARFLGILHLAMHDAYFATFPYSSRLGATQQFADDFEPYLSTSILDSVKPATISSEKPAEAKEAVAGAAITVLNKLFKAPNKRDPGFPQQTAAMLNDFIDASVRAYQHANPTNSRSAAFSFGAKIACMILDQLEIKASEPGVDALSYEPNSNLPYWFDDDPSHPVRLRPVDPNDPEDGQKATRPFHGPYYGISAAILATTHDIKIADPPLNPSIPPLDPSNPPDLSTSPTPEYLKYLEAVEDVHRMGGAEELATTKRQPVQTVGGLFWAYDGSNLIGTPPRLYNQIVKQIAFDESIGSDINSDENNAQFIRLLALVNVAMADAGIFCWRDKYKYELWRPLSGVRADPTGPVPGGYARPTWRVLGAPSTNTNETGFKPPFPAYPSGHATFAAAAFQMVRLFYNQRGDKKLFQEHSSSANDVKSFEPQLQKSMDNAKLKVDRNVANDSISFTFISDELNGISRTLYQPYNPSLPLESQPGDVRTRIPVTFSSLKEAIFSNAMSRIWLGVHWHFDGFAGETVCEKYERDTPNDGKDINLPQPNDRRQLFKIAPDGSTIYQDAGRMDWFAAESLGPRDGAGKYPVGGVPLGMLIADDIFDNKMRSCGSLVNLGGNIDARRT